MRGGAAGGQAHSRGREQQEQLDESNRVDLRRRRALESLLRVWDWDAVANMCLEAWAGNGYVMK